jgi:hypothetical protein
MTRAPSDFAVGVVENYVAALEMLAKAQQDQKPYVLLAPTVPLPAKEKAGWFGGAPLLPDDCPWPEIGGERLRFVCQLNLAGVSKDIWSGVGPRRGWLVFFLHPEDLKPRVLHVEGPLRKREGPGQSDATWIERDYRNPEPVRDHSPEWPVTMTRHVGPLPRSFVYRKSTDPELQKWHRNNVGDLSDPAFQPFNKETLGLLLCQLEKCLEWKRSQIMALLSNTLHDETVGELLSMKELGQLSYHDFSRMKEGLLPFTDRFELEPVTKLVSELANISTHQILYHKNDEQGFACLDISTSSICSKAHAFTPGSWYPEYARRLYVHAVYAYTTDPESLPPDLRRRMEQRWQVEKDYESGAMGGAPSGHVWTPHGNATPNTVLLELPSSAMLGWIWGDVYRVVFFISRDDLSRGILDNVTCEITN